MVGGELHVDALVRFRFDGPPTLSNIFTFQLMTVEEFSSLFERSEALSTATSICPSAVDAVFLLLLLANTMLLTCGRSCTLNRHQPH
jgi:hypothetical protein